MYLPLLFVFFPFWVFFHKHSQITGLQGKGEGISLTPHYHLHPLHTHLDISQTITAESSPLHILAARLELVSKCKLLTINLCSLKKVYFHKKIFPGNLLLWTVSQKLQIWWKILWIQIRNLISLEIFLWFKTKSLIWLLF